MAGGQTHTHDLTFTESEVRKRYVSWDRGEADREWACLTLLAEHAPGLAPKPLRRETDDGAPVVVMERLPGATRPAPRRHRPPTCWQFWTDRRASSSFAKQVPDLGYEQ